MTSNPSPTKSPMVALVDKFKKQSLKSKDKQKLKEQNILVGSTDTHWKQTTFVDEGGMAEIYNVYAPGEIDDTANYVVKRGRNITQEIRVYKKLFTKELTADKPYLPTYIDSGLVKSDAFLIIPKYNRPITADMAKGMTDNLFLKLVEDVLLGLQYLHNANYCHNDVKPSNVLFNTKTGRFVLIDFGVASRWEASGNLSYTTSKFSGTKIYAGLDMHVAQKGPSPRSDLDSLIFTMLTWAGLNFPWRPLKSLSFIYKGKMEFLENPDSLLKNCKSELKKSLLRQFIDINKTTPLSRCPDYVSLFNAIAAVTRNSLVSCCKTCDKLNEGKDKILTSSKKPKALIAVLMYMELWDVE